MAYLDGFVLPVPVKKLDAYMKIAKKAGKIWMDHGALAYWECALEDKTENSYCLSFPKAFKPKKGETVIFSYIVFKSRKHRDAVNRKVMKDERMSALCDPKDMPFDCARMAYGGFKPVVTYC